MPKPQPELRADALRVAEKLVVEGGLANLSARRVAANAGCSVGTLYNMFGHLDGLIEAVALSTLRMLNDRLATAIASLPGSADRDARLSTLARTYLRFARTHRNRWTAAFAHRETGAPDAVRDMIDRQLFARIAAAAGLDSTGAHRREEEEGLRMLLAAVHGVVAFAVGRDLPPGDAERHLDLIVRATVRGYREREEETAQ